MQKKIRLPQDAAIQDGSGPGEHLDGSDVEGHGFDDLVRRHGEGIGGPAGGPDDLGLRRSPSSGGELTGDDGKPSL